MAVVDRRRVLSPNVPWRALAVIALLAILLVATLAAYVGSHQRRLPAPFGPAATGAIVYAKDGDIFARDTPTAAPRLLIGGATNDEGATFSHQGDRFLFFRVVSDVDNCQCEVWIANADGSGAHKLAGGPYHNPTAWDWSPDGTKIVLGYDLANTNVVAVIPTDGSPENVLDLKVEASGPIWRPPSGDQILFRGGDPNSDGQLYVVRSDGSGLTPLNLPTQQICANDVSSHSFAWSPDGRRLAYCTAETLKAAGVGTGLRIHVAELGPTGQALSDRRLEFESKDDHELNPAWLPAGDRIVFEVREGTADYLELGDIGPGTPEAGALISNVGPDSGTQGGIGYEIAPDGHSLLVLFWTEQKAWQYDLDKHSAIAADLGPLDISSYQRLAP